MPNAAKRRTESVYAGRIATELKKVLAQNPASDWVTIGAIVKLVSDEALARGVTYEAVCEALAIGFYRPGSN